MTQSTITDKRNAVMAAACHLGRGPRRGWYEIECLISAVRRYDEAVLAEIGDSEGAFVLGSPETSRRSAVAIMPRTGTIRRAVLNDIAGRHDGLATDEMIERSLRGKHQTISSARNHLVNAGWLEDSRQRVKDNKAVLWQLTEAAKRQLDLKGNQ